MDKGLTVPKWMLIVSPKIPQNLSAQFVRPSPEVWDFNEKRLHWASVVRGMYTKSFRFYCKFDKSQNVNLHFLLLSLSNKELNGKLQDIATSIF